MLGIRVNWGELGQICSFLYDIYGWEFESMGVIKCENRVWTGEIRLAISAGGLFTDLIIIYYVFNCIN